MTTVPGHNIVIQQSGAAQELSSHAHASKQSAEQAEIQQQNNELVKNSTVQKFDASEKMKSRKEKDAQKRQLLKKKTKKKQLSQELESDPNATGKILDTTV